MDRTPPVLSITNPAGGTVALPYVQVRGFANEPLTGATFDLSNALGVVTGQPGMVTGELLDTNLMAFTTNFFACLDISLTNGLNVVTVHGTDLAGNTGSTTLTLTQDCSAKTPPQIQLDWPADGMQIGRTSMTVHGTLDEPTAAIGLQVSDDAGVHLAGMEINSAVELCGGGVILHSDHSLWGREAPVYAFGHAGRCNHTSPP